MLEPSGLKKKVTHFLLTLWKSYLDWTLSIFIDIVALTSVWKLSSTLNKPILFISSFNIKTEGLISAFAFSLIKLVIYLGLTEPYSSPFSLHSL